MKITIELDPNNSDPSESWAALNDAAHAIDALLQADLTFDLEIKMPEKTKDTVNAPWRPPLARGMDTIPVALRSYPDQNGN